MIDVFYSEKDTPYVWASDLHKLLNIGTPLSTWFPRMIDYGFTEDTDYFSDNKYVDSANNIKKAVFDWAVSLDMAKNIAMIQRTPQGKEIRDYLLNLDQKVSEGEYLNHAQIMALFDICKVMGYFSVQSYFENEHYEAVFRTPGLNWWQERANLFGYTAKELQEALRELGLKYRNQRQAIFKLEKYELIRIGVIDLFMAMGKSKAYAKNVGNIAKTIAKEIKPEIYNDLEASIDFKSQDQKIIITDLKAYKSQSQILDKFMYSKEQRASQKKSETQLDLKLGSKSKSQ
ncbi:MAG TPA: antA/AntB antirepressor family protein [Mucilaginibacter sp.]|jgi:phage anti-repressor protein|nr:antA/AntB antirepressor family protein [Mucilaginibacter sp.]